MKTRIKLLVTLLIMLPYGVNADGYCEDYPNDVFCQSGVTKLLGISSNKGNTEDVKFSDGTLEERDYNFMSDEGDHFKELVEQGAFLSASELFNKYEFSFFTQTSLLGGELRTDKYQNEIDKTAQYLIDSNAKDFSSVITVMDTAIKLVQSSKISLANKWSTFSSILKANEKSKNYYNIHRVIKYKQDGEGGAISTLTLKKNELTRALKSIASKEFDRFDFASSRGFFEEYPVQINKAKIIAGSSKTIINLLSNSTLDESIVLIDKYKLNKSKTIESKLAGILLDKASRATYGDDQPKFMDVVTTLKQIKDLGINIEPSELPVRYKSTFYVINKTQDFNNLKKVLSNPEPYLVVIDKRRLSVKKGNAILKKISSQYVSKTENVLNPKYVIAKRNYNNSVTEYKNAERSYQSALASQQESSREYQRQEEMRRLNAGSSTNCSGYGNSINCTTTRNTPMFVPDYSQSLGGIAPSIRKGVMNQKRKISDNFWRRLNNTQKEIKNVIYDDYSFTTKTYEVVKNYEYNVYVINKVSTKHSLTSIPLETQKVFVLASNINQQDSSHKPSHYETLDDIEIFATGRDDHSIGDLMSKIPSDYSLINYSSIKDLINNIEISYKEPSRNSSREVTSDRSPNRNSPEGFSYIKDLKRIKALLDSGVIDKDDFETLKQKIINKL